MTELAPETEPSIVGDARRPRRVREVDFSRPTKFAPDQQRRFERAHEGFCRSASTRLSAELRNPMLIEIVESDQLTWSAALATVPDPCVYVVLGIEELGSEIVMAAEMSWIMRVFDRLLGGSGKGSLERGELTEIETAVTRRTLAAVVEQLSITWEDLLGFHLQLRRIEVKTSNLHVAPASEPSLKLQLAVRDARGEAVLALVVPYRSIETAISRLSGEEFDGSARVAEPAAAVRRALASVDVSVRAEVATFDLKLSEILALAEGSILPLGVSPDGGVTVYANSVPIHRARPGRSGARRAIEILERLEPEL